MALGHRNDWISRQKLYLDSELILDHPIPKLRDVWNFLIQPPNICLIKSLRSLRNEISQDPSDQAAPLPYPAKQKYSFSPQKSSLNFSLVEIEVSHALWSGRDDVLKPALVCI